ncbi:MAG: family 20 glycosylhydrolase [Spirochaetaceae bacterium]|nr:family 20 glycosylhydrolase [Spirochaetaceae bacterium]
MNFVSYRVEYLEKWIVKLAGMGYTALLWEPEDKVRWETCPEVSNHGFTKTELTRLLQLSRDLGLENIPLLQTLGHAEYVLKHDEYAHLREDPDYHDCYCTTNSAARVFLKTWIDEYVDLFGDIRQFHLGGDEVYRFASCPDCHQVSAEIGKIALYSEFLQDVAGNLLENSITPGIWADVILTDPRSLNAISKDFRIWDWNYWDGTDPPRETMVWGRGIVSQEELNDTTENSIPGLFTENGDLRAFHTVPLLRQKGFHTILCGSSRSSGDSFFVGQHNLHGPNIIGACRKAIEENLCGVCVTSWAIRIHPWETQELWLRMAPIALNHPDWPTEKIEEAAVRELVDFSGREVIMILEGIGTTFPFFRLRESGIQYDHLKDTEPPPDDYLTNLVEEWRDTTGLIPKLLEEVERGRTLLRQASEKLGMLTSQTLSKSTTSGFLRSLTKASELQETTSLIADAILRYEISRGTIDGIAAAIAQASESMFEWSVTWMNDNYARKITTLLFRGVTEYVNQQLSGDMNDE